MDTIVHSKVTTKSNGKCRLQKGDVISGHAVC